MGTVEDVLAAEFRAIIGDAKFDEWACETVAARLATALREAGMVRDGAIRPCTAAGCRVCAHVPPLPEGTPE